MKLITIAGRSKSATKAVYLTHMVIAKMRIEAIESTMKR